MGKVIRTITLPEPSHKGILSLEELLMGRNSVREYQDTSIPLGSLSQILWASCGETVFGKTIPSAGACYPLRFYIIAKKVSGLEEGVYHYQPHFLESVKEGDIDFNYYNAPAYIVIAADPSKTIARYGERGNRYIHMEAGHAAQNITLQALSLGLGSVMVGSFNDGKIKELLGIQEEPLYIIPLGRGK